MRWAHARHYPDHTRGLFHPCLDATVDELLLKYTRSVAQEGVQARLRGPIGARIEAGPRPSARGHIQEIMAQLLHDAAKGEFSSVPAYGTSS